MTVTSAVATAKARNQIKAMAESLGYGALDSGMGLTENYTDDVCLLQDIVNVPVELFVVSEVTIDSSFKTAHT